MSQNRHINAMCDGLRGAADVISGSDVATVGCYLTVKFQISRFSSYQNNNINTVLLQRRRRTSTIALTANAMAFRLMNSEELLSKKMQQRNASMFPKYVLLRIVTAT